MLIDNSFRFQYHYKLTSTTYAPGFTSKQKLPSFCVGLATASFCLPPSGVKVTVLRLLDTFAGGLSMCTRPHKLKLYHNKYIQNNKHNNIQDQIAQIYFDQIGWVELEFGPGRVFFFFFFLNMLGMNFFPSLFNNFSKAFFLPGSYNILGVLGWYSW